MCWRFLGGQLSDLCWTLHWRWAGHLARYSCTAPPLIANNWLNYEQFLFLRNEMNFRHPNTARVWRWEQNLINFCGSEKVTPFVGSLFQDCSWQNIAQDKLAWKELEPAFVASRVVLPRQQQLAIEDVREAVVLLDELAES